jgi:hypothetical protein
VKTRLLGVAYAVGGILLAFALTMGAYVLAGSELSQPVGPVRIDSGGGLAPREARSPGAADETPSPPGDGEGGVDVSGPCDEPEHADDPECAGEGRGGGNQGPGGGETPEGDNSGPGSGDGDDDDGGDSSGPGSGDNSGSGSDNSGSGSSGSSDD